MSVVSTVNVMSVMALSVSWKLAVLDMSYSCYECVEDNVSLL